MCLASSSGAQQYHQHSSLMAAPQTETDYSSVFLFLSDCDCAQPKGLSFSLSHTLHNFTFLLFFFYSVHVAGFVSFFFCSRVLCSFSSATVP